MKVLTFVLTTTLWLFVSSREALAQSDSHTTTQKNGDTVTATFTQGEGGGLHSVTIQVDDGDPENDPDPEPVNEAVPSMSGTSDWGCWTGSDGRQYKARVTYEAGKIKKLQILQKTTSSTAGDSALFSQSGSSTTGMTVVIDVFLENIDDNVPLDTDFDHPDAVKVFTETGEVSSSDYTWDILSVDSVSNGNGTTNYEVRYRVVIDAMSSAPDFVASVFYATAFGATTYDVGHMVDIVEKN